MDKAPRITVKNLDMAYGDFVIMRDNSIFTINNGRHLHRHGRSGCGKSTLLRVLVG
jgi:phospholipid/cholesterol/gamma-HCH transport system ATP-binding protein